MYLNYNNSYYYIFKYIATQSYHPLEGGIFVEKELKIYQIYAIIHETFLFLLCYN